MVFYLKELATVLSRATEILFTNKEEARCAELATTYVQILNGLLEQYDFQKTPSWFHETLPSALLKPDIWIPEFQEVIKAKREKGESSTTLAAIELATMLNLTDKEYAMKKIYGDHPNSFTTLIQILSHVANFIDGTPNLKQQFCVESLDISV